MKRIEEPIRDISEAEVGRLVKTNYAIHRIFDVSKDKAGKVTCITGVTIEDGIMWEVEIFPGVLTYNHTIDPENKKFVSYTQFLDGFSK